MQIKLIDGKFTHAEADELITKIIRTKIVFLEQKTVRKHPSAADIQYAHSRIEQLQQYLQKMKSELALKNEPFITIHASIEINLPPSLHQ